jgi:D-glycero-D-manno-heptose 1,7-bisphosphate phosphatase
MLVLLDRDGVINHDLPEGVVQFEEFQFLPRAIEAIAMLTKAGFFIAICTNQSAVGKGTLSLEMLDRIHAFMCAEVSKAGGRIDAIYAAYDAPDVPSIRRKPAPGMLLEALETFGADASRTPFVGDMLRDLQAAVAAGCPRILVRTGKGATLETQGIPDEVAPVAVYDDLFAAAQAIIADYR